MAGRHARLAARAAVEVHLEGELLAGAGRARRQQGRVVPALKRLVRVLVELREPLDGAQVALLGQERADQAAAPPRVPRRRPGARNRHGTAILVELHRHTSHGPRPVPWASSTGSARPDAGPMGSQPAGRGTGPPLTRSSGKGRGRAAPAIRPFLCGRAKGAADRPFAKPKGRTSRTYCRRGRNLGVNAGIRGTRQAASSANGSVTSDVRTTRDCLRSRLVADRQPEKFRQRADPELPHQAGAAQLDGPGRDLQAGGDLLVRPPVPDHLQDFALLVGQRLQPRPDLVEVGLARQAVGVVLDRALDLLQQDLTVERLLEELDGPRLHRPDGHRHIGISRDEHHRDPQAPRGQLLEQIEPAGSRHPDVEDQTGGAISGEPADELRGRRERDGAQSHGLQQPAQRVPHVRVVIDDVDRRVSS